MIKALLIYLAAVNLAAFVLYGIDKRKAVKHKWRIPEATLILIAAIGGSVGALLGMFFFRHKTKHVKFIIGVPLILVIQIALCVYLTAKI